MRAQCEAVEGGAVDGTDVEEPSTHPSCDRSATVMLDRVTVLEAAAASAGLDILLISCGGGPSVKYGAEDGASNSWCGKVGEFGEEFDSSVGLPGRGALPYVG